MEIRWSDEKNSVLKQTRNVSFEDVENAIMSNNILDIIPHHNQEKYSHQELMDSIDTKLYLLCAICYE